MRAARIHEFGEPLIVEEVDAPDPTVDEVVVDVTHAGVNPIDLRLRDGGAGRVALPFIPGCEGVGRTAGGPVVLHGHGLGVRRPGTYAQTVAVPSGAVAPIPEGVDLVEAAGLGMAGVTAWGLVNVAARVVPDDRVLVLGASGGVGSLAVQLAAFAGARVCGQVSSDADVRTLQRLGAMETVVSGPDDLREAARELAPTVVIDGVGGAFTGAALRALDPGGRIVVFGAAAGATGEIDLSLLYRKAATIRGYANLTLPADQQRRAVTTCLELLATGRLRVHVDGVLSLDQVNEAHARLAERRATGKIVLATDGG